jgi:two-component sensor histidine kinase
MALRVLKRGDRVKHALDVQRTLTDELDHRVKNAFALVGGMISAARRSAANTDEFADILTGRLYALATAHGLARREFSPSGAEIRVTALGDLIATILAPYENKTERDHIVLSGPLVPCGDRCISSLALVFHELATNAAKYGALTSDAGSLHVTWQIEGDYLSVQWREKTAQPYRLQHSHTGFGTSLMDNLVTYQLAGQIAKGWTQQGLTAAITLPLTSLGA